MANYSLVSCLGDNQKKITASTDRDILVPGDIVAVNEEGIVSCCEVLNETLDEPTAQIISEPTNCLQCLIDNNINFIFTDCSSKKEEEVIEAYGIEPTPTYVISPTYFSYLPTVGKFYYTQLQGEKDSIYVCLQFQSTDTLQNPDTNPLSLPIESDSCEKCNQPSFNYLTIERNNNAGFQQKQESFKNNYNEYINNRTINVPK